MTENEKRLRKALAKYGGMIPDEVRWAAEALMAEAQSARDAALEEAEHIAERCRKERETLATNEFMYERSKEAQAALVGKQSEAERIRDAVRALKSQPARRYLDAEKVREEAVHALRQPGTSVAWKQGVAALSDALGSNVDDVLQVVLGIDAAPACPVCEAPAGQPHKMSCRTTERAAAVEYATEENGLLPKRRKP